MGKLGLTLATICLAGTIAGAGLSINYAANSDNYKERLKEQYSTTYEEKIALSYGQLSETLEVAGDYLGSYIIKGEEIRILSKPDKAKALLSLIQALNESSELAEKDDEYYTKTNRLYERVTSLETENLNKNAKDFQELENQIYKLSDELNIKALDLNPNYQGILVAASNYDEGGKAAGGVFGSIFSCVGVIICGVWMGYQAKEVADEVSYYRKQNKRTRNKI
jgi:hypothetical protein